MHRLKQSDEAAFDILFDHFQEDIFKFLCYKSNDVNLAEDLLQEVFLKLWETRHKLDVDKSIKTYLFTIAHNLFLNHVRHKKVITKHANDAGRESIFVVDDPHFQLEEGEFKAALMAAIEQLPESMRAIFLMSRIDGLPNKEIADRLAISVRTVESQLYKALIRVNEAIPGEYYFRLKK